MSSQLLTTTPAGVGKEVNGAVMTNSTRAEFEAEVAKLKTTSNSGPSDRRVASLGVILSIVGLVIVVVMYSQATDQADQRDQMESLIMALFGIGLVIFGSVLYLRNSMTRFLRLWLLRLIYEQRDLAGTTASSPTPVPPAAAPSAPSASAAVSADARAGDA
jgi:hypothetical protein